MRSLIPLRERYLVHLLTAGTFQEPASSSSIPEGWQVCDFGSLCDLSSGNGFTPRDWSQQGLPIIRIQNLNGSPDFNYFSGEPDPKWIIEPGDLLFAWAGVKGISFGPCIWFGARGVLNQHIYKITPHDGIEKIWLYETLKMLTSKIEERAHGFKLELVHVRKGEITGQKVALPPPDKQEEIAKKSVALSELEKNCREHAERLIQMKKSLMKQLMQ